MFCKKYYFDTGNSFIGHHNSMVYIIEEIIDHVFHSAVHKAQNKEHLHINSDNLWQ